MEVPSSNVATTCESPNLETERTFGQPGQAADGQLDGQRDLRLGLLRVRGRGTTVLICTCTGVVSGKASIGSDSRARTPSHDQHDRQ